MTGEWKLFSACISHELFNLVQYLIDREEMKQIVFVKRAVTNFMAGDKKIDPRLLITKRTDPDYVIRQKTFVVRMNTELIEQIKEVAEEKHTNASTVFFQALADYCAMIISLDDTGINIQGK